LQAPKTAILTTPLCSGTVCHLGKSSYQERIIEDTLALNSSQDYFSIDRAYVENVAEELARFRPDILFFDPIYLHWFARRAAETGIALPPVKALASSYQYCSQLQRKALSELLQAPLYDWYSATETAAVVGQECPAGRLHVRPEQCVVEIVGEDGVVAPGVLGKILVTTLASRTMPLVRYQIGDVGSLTDEPCTCLLNGSQCLTLHGRAKDMLCVQNRPVTTRQFDQMISDTAHLDFYSCTQTEADTLVVDVIPSLGQESVFAKAELADKLRSRLGIAKVEVRLVSRLDPLPSLKYRQTFCATKDMSAFL
jgi:phenylacetate-CoA ligase